MELPEFFVLIQDFCGALVERYGPWGVAAAMFIESAGVPFASSVVLLAAGGMFLTGRAKFWTLFIASTAGIIAVSTLSYLIGYLGERLGQVVGSQVLNRRKAAPPPRRPPRLEKIYAFMEKYGTYSIFAGQLWGVTRTFISFPAGAMHMNFLVFLASTALGGALFSLWIIGWSIILTGAAGLLLLILRILTSLSPWIWPPLLLCAAGLACLYLKKRRK